ncbi:MAG: hypothetical protein JO056_01405 [Alphaproteobacteria bacterium]|nr:hypothetical protein [Alphaproteobacteria bacterium]
MFTAIEFGRNTSWSFGCYRLWFTPSGNLELSNEANGKIVWQTGTQGKKMAMQEDGNLAIYGDDGACIWSSGTFGNARAFLAAQDDGNLVIYSAREKPLWESRTAGK